jgi:hypothetical protein
MSTEAGRRMVQQARSSELSKMTEMMNNIDDPTKAGQAAK